MLIAFVFAMEAPVDNRIVSCLSSWVIAGYRKMNRLLAQLASELNWVFGLIIAAGCGYLGYDYARIVGSNLTFWTGIGLIVGIIQAAIVCGAIALLVRCEQYLRYIAEDVEMERKKERLAAGLPPYA
jgi:hypothetical protein